MIELSRVGRATIATATDDCESRVGDQQGPRVVLYPGLVASRTSARSLGESKSDGQSGR